MKIDRLRVSAFSIPTASPEADGTLEWDRTVLVTVELSAGGAKGFGYTYADAATAHFVREHLAKIVLAADPWEPEATFSSMSVAVRNVGREGVAATAIAAVDMSGWDLRAKLAGRPLVQWIGARRQSIAAYASGGFTSYTVDELRGQLAGWRDEGFSRVKMKVGGSPDAAARVRAAREAIGGQVELFVDANGAYGPKQALLFAERVAAYGVSWLEEPVSSDDLCGLRFVRERAPASMLVAAGEYGYRSLYFERMLAAQAVDVLQADATRCGVTGFLAAAALCDARGVPLSAHCAPTVHAHLCCAVRRAAHVEYFCDHSRIEQMLLDGAAAARGGSLYPDPSRPGLGVELKRTDAARYLVLDHEEGRGHE